MINKVRNNYVILFVLQSMITVFLLVGCFRQEQLLYSMNGTDYISNKEQSMIKSEYLVLSPGVYQVRVQSDIEDEQGINVELKYEKAHFNSVRGNKVHISSGENYVDFEVYVMEQVSNAYVQCDFEGTDASGLVQLDVCKTNIGNRLLFLIVLVIFLLVDAMLIFRKRILEGQVSKKQQVIFWVLVTGIMVANYPYLAGYIIEGDVVSGLFQYVPMVLTRLGLPLMSAHMVYQVLMTLITITVIYMCLKWWSKDEYAALFGSMLYLVSPYRLTAIYKGGEICFWSLLSLMGALLATFLFKRAQSEKNKGLQLLLGIVGTIWLLSAVYQINDILYQSEAIYLYHEEAIELE